MATWLSEYKNLKNEMEKQVGAGHASPGAADAVSGAVVSY